MKKLAEQAERFILRHSLWAYFTGVLFTSIVLVYQEGRHEWPVYLGYAGRISLLFAPVLAFCGFRRWLQEQLPLSAYLGLWAFCFLAYPYLIEMLGWQAFVASSGMGKVAVRLTGAWFLGTEFALLLNHYWLKGQGRRPWVKKISLEKGILLFTAFFSICYAWLWFYVPGNGKNEASVFTMISYTLQIFIILLIYYTFYWINHYFLINKVLKQRGAIYYGLAFIATIVLFYPLAAQFIAWLPMVRQTDIHPVQSGRIFEDINALVPFFGMLFSIPFILAIKWFRQNHELAALARERSETELNLLKQQINPHFFFNTLNNLYALSITRDEKTPEVIMQLAELMRYVIYRGREDSVALGEEVRYIEDYLRLQQIRLHQRLDLRFDKEIADEKLAVPPLLFITLVENAFKHGIEPAESACSLHLCLKSSGKNLFFSCENSFEESISVEKGIGLDNLKRRLELRFPQRHELQAIRSETTYKATLKLSL